jgi:hypothetical protein
VSTWEWLPQVRLAISQALVGAGTTGVFYLALEPHVRRRWPTVLVAWSRVLSGRWRDPLVGRDVLAGVAMGAAAAPVALFFGWWDHSRWTRTPAPLPVCSPYARQWLNSCRFRSTCSRSRSC